MIEIALSSTYLVSLFSIHSFEQNKNGQNSLKKVAYFSQDHFFLLSFLFQRVVL